MYVEHNETRRLPDETFPELQESDIDSVRYGRDKSKKRLISTICFLFGEIGHLLLICPYIYVYNMYIESMFMRLFHLSLV